MAILDRLTNIFSPGVKAGSKADIVLEREEQQDVQKQNDRLAYYESRFARDWKNNQGPMHQENLAGMEEWKRTVDPSDPTPKDYVYLYGTQRGLQTWNDLGFGQATLSMGKQFDPFNSYVNEEGELVPYVRVADTDQGKFYSAPFTVDGRKFSEVAEEFGPGRMPDNEELAINFKQLEMPYIKYKVDVFQRPQAEMFYSAAGADQKIDWFTENARPQLLNILESEGMVEAQKAKDLETLEAAGAPTEVVGGEPQPRTPTFESNPVFGSVEEFKTQFSKDRKVAAIGTPSAFGRSVAMDVDPIYVAPSKEMLEKYSNYVPNKDTHALNFSDADWENMTTAEQNNAIKYEKALQKKTLNTAMDSADKVINQPQNLSKVKNYYKTNRESLKKSFMQDPQLYEEFNANPYEFAKKYSQGNQNELFGKPVAPKDVKNLQQETVVPSTKLDKKTVANIMLAAENQDIIAFKKGIEDLIAGGKLSETGQQTLASVLQQYNNNFQRANESTRLAIVGDMAASLSDTSLNMFMPYLMRFADTGRLNFEGDKVANDQAKIAQAAYEFEVEQQQNLTKEGGISETALELEKIMRDLNMDEIKERGLGTSVAGTISRAVEGGSLMDRSNAERTLNLFVSKAVADLAQNSIWRTNPLTRWMFEKVPERQLELFPRVRAFGEINGEKDKEITNIEDAKNNKITHFQVVGTGGQVVGARIPTNDLIEDFGPSMPQILFYQSLMGSK